MTQLKLYNLQEAPIFPYYFKAINHHGKPITIKIRTINIDNEQELYELAKSMARIFASSEPMTVAANITEEECFEEIYLYLQFAKKDDLSLVLINEETGKIIGGIIGRDFYNEINENPFEKLVHKEKFQSIISFINISRNKFLNIIAKEGHVLEAGLVYVGVYIGFFGKYIILNDEEGFNLTAISFRKCEEYLKNLGYKYFYTEATNPGSQKLCRNSGWTTNEIIIPYKPYEPFTKINFRHNAIFGIGNSMCGAIQRTNKLFPPLSKTVNNRNKVNSNKY